MKKKIVLKRFFHREKWRLGIFSGYDPKLVSLAKSVPGATYSGTNKCFYLDDNEGSLKRVLKVFRDYADIDISEISSSVMDKKREAEQSKQAHIINDNQPVEAHSQDLSFPSPGPGAKRSRIISREKYGPVEFTINEETGRLIIKFTGRYDPVWIKEMKSYGRLIFDPVRLEWQIAWSRLTVDSLADYFSTKEVEVIVKKTEVASAVKELRDMAGAEIRDRILEGEAMAGMEKVRNYLDERRYSVNTTEAYISLLGLFFKYFIPATPSEITEDDISDFFHDYILFHDYSSSYQNQLISAIKLYYTINGSRSIDTSLLGRPRRSRALPRVFSKEEVKSILNSAHNTKHRLLLWMIYSCGLRRSEVTNIKLKDLDRERSILNIREAKGMVDRIVPVSAKVWDKIDGYVEEYHPSFWLFEGQTGGRYSSESVYRVFKQALKRAGIKKEVGVHSLRHSYATHLHENGLDIRYIQELLGHRSTRTTEIYTHVSRRNLVAVRSPIEDLDLN
jgi:integrase/recombinase XerD